MKFTVLGSGGCVALPKPLCQCNICKEARKKGKPYSRYGCSLFIHDINLLIDTPEDIVHSLNYFNITSIDSVIFSHMDPDHTLGMRIFEQLRLNWLEVAKGNECSNPIDVFAMEHVMEDLNLIKTKYGPFLDYYENVRNLIKRNTVDDSINIDDIKIIFVKVNHATIFVFEQGESKIIYAPCDVKPFPKNDIFKNAEMMIIGNTIVGDILKQGYILEANNILTNELFSMNEIIDLKEKYNIKKVIITHLEEDWGKSYDDYLKLQENYKNIVFAYDGMELQI